MGRRHGMPRCRRRGLHLRLRHWDLRGSDLHGPVPGEVLPGGVPAEELGPPEQLLQVRQPGPLGLHVLPVPRRPGLLPRRLARDEELRPARQHCLRRRQLPHRRRPQCGRREPRHAHPRPHHARCRHRFRQPGRAAVPVGDGAGAPPGWAEHDVPAGDDAGHLHGEHDQLRHAEPEAVGLAPLAGPCCSSGAADDRGRAAPAGDAQQPDRARARPGRVARSGAHPGHGGRGRGVHGHGGSQRAGQHHRAPVPEHPGAPEPAAAGDGGVHAGVPDPDGDQLHPLLRARAVPDHGLRRRRLALLLRHHRRRALLLHAHLHRHRRPPRPPEAPHQRRHPDDRLPGDRGGDTRGEVRDGQAADAGLLGRGGGGDLPVRDGVRVVVGAAGVDGAERDLPAGDAIGGAEHHGGRQPLLHLRHRAGVPVAALRLQVRHLPLLRRVDHRHDRLRLRLPAGDQGRAHRGDGAALEEALVLEEGHAGHAAPRGGRVGGSRGWCACSSQVNTQVSCRTCMLRFMRLNTYICRKDWTKDARTNAEAYVYVVVTCSSCYDL